MPKTEFEALKADIATNGLREPIVLYQGKVLDGRHRYLACKELEGQGQLPERPADGWFRLFDGTDADAKLYVTSLNMFRRHLNKSQRAMILVSAGLVAPPPEGGRRRKPGTGRDAIMDVGRKYGVNHMTLYKAAYVHARDPKLAEDVQNGKLSVSAAEKQIRDAEQTVVSPTDQPQPALLLGRVRTLGGLLRRAEVALGGTNKGVIIATDRDELISACEKLIEAIKARPSSEPAATTRTRRRSNR